MTDTETVSKSKEKILKELYQKLPEIKQFLASKGCNASDAEDVFQEALLIFSRKFEDPHFELTTEPFHYVKNTCKFVWYNASRKQRKMSTTELKETVASKEEEWWLKELQLRQIEVAISKIGEKCQQLLKLFYGKGATMQVIAQKLGLRNDKVAKAQKYRCINKVKEVIEKTETSGIDNDFLTHKL